MGYEADEVKRYYESNTSLFLRLGQGHEGTIRRAVWGPGVTSRREAMIYVDDLILEHVRSLAKSLGRAPRILDLGCGVGASLCRMARSLDIVGTGVTISPSQAELGARRVEQARLTESVRILQADFSRLPEDVRDHDLAFAIESFVHAPDASRFFTSAVAALRPGGVLIVCDDFASKDALELSSTEIRWLARYREGWRVSSLLGPTERDRVVNRAGLAGVEDRDLTEFVELGRPRDYAIALLARGLGWLPLGGAYWGMLKGGDALQRCLKRGWLSYRFLVWKKTESV